MKNRITAFLDLPALALLVVVLGVMTATIGAQDRLKTMPGYDQFQKMSKEIPGALKSGQLNATWKDDGKALEYALNGKMYRFDMVTRQAAETGEAAPAPGGRGGRGQVAPPAAQGQTPPARGQGQGQVPAQTPPGRGQGQGAAPARGRQVASALSPDGKLRATYHDADQNLYMSNADGSDESPITTDGSKKNRIKYGTASWVYGEELSQTTAMWWSPDSRKLAYYRFDEGKVPDYVLQMKQTALYSEIDTEAYPKPGQPNPIVELFVYDIATKKSTRVDVRDGKPFENNVVGHYVYHVAWSPDGTELLFNRTNRRQNIMELTAANPDNKYFVDVYQTHDVPPATRVADATNGKVVAELAASDVSRFNQLGLKKAEMFTYKAADGKTVLHGLISFPSNFDPAMRYPTLVSVYGGPAANQNCARETFVPASPTAEYGFLLLLTAKS